MEVVLEVGLGGRIQRFLGLEEVSEGVPCDEGEDEGEGETRGTRCPSSCTMGAGMGEGDGEDETRLAGARRLLAPGRGGVPCDEARRARRN